MTYIRMTGGSERGTVKDLPFPEAQEMLALGQALPVNFDEPDALGYRQLATPHEELSVSSQCSADAVLRGPRTSPKLPVPAHLTHREGKKKR